ncbi:multiheme c-type cytochrome [Thiolapillus sp.]
MKRSVSILGVLSLLFLSTALAEPSGWWKDKQLPSAAPQAQVTAEAAAEAPAPAAQPAQAQAQAKPVETTVAMNNNEPVKILSGFNQLSRESATCMSCHREKTPGIYEQWGSSKHFGANVGCYECHKADRSDKDAIMHKDFVISVIVSPKDCGQCHEYEVDEFDRSHHSTAGDILGSLDNVLAEVVEGAPTLSGTSPVTVMGCAACHGSIVRVNSDGTLDKSSWPNTGIGRINPDGSKGACTACHFRHEFSAAQAREPEACSRCHLGPDHPQKEVYEESAHGIAYKAHKDKMNMDSSKWIVGEDYDSAPTCATCHMSRTKDLPVTHDVGDRISWNLRAPVSVKIDEKAIKQGKKVKPWLERRQDMKSVCRSCHGNNIVDAHFEQLDVFVTTFNDKFLIPAKKLYVAMLENGLRDKTKFNESIEWNYFYLWHHEGRRARHGAAMFAPDYVHWEGVFEVAHRFYIEMVPEIKEAIAHARDNGNVQGADKMETLLNEVLDSPMHRWFKGGKPPKAWRPSDDNNHGFNIMKDRMKAEAEAAKAEK